MRVYTCGVPKADCSGAIRNYSSGIRSVVFKTHVDPSEAFQCHARWLVSKGFTRIGSREFINPENGAIRVLTKPIRFGGMLRHGKKEKTVKSKTFLPGVRSGGLMMSL